MDRRRAAGLAGAAVLIGSAVAFGPGASAQQLAPITFTTAQANAGRSAFGDNCAGCHGAQLQGAGGPALTGAGFQSDWFGKPVGALYEFVSTNMPYDNPGGLTGAQYVSLVAFLAQSNGLMAGSTALPGDLEALNAMGFR
ncbi:MAG: c-type cytochrome [Bauldia sp.]